MGNQMDLVSRVSNKALRLSIIVPLQGDALAFEATLISILENRPADAEVVVCHDGSYDDPFDLCDEVKFVTTQSNSFMDLISAGAAAASGRFAHVVSGGLEVTSDWTDAALEKFEHFDCGSVAPIVRDRHGNQIIAAGWEDSTTRLCHPASNGRESVGSSKKLVGAFLQASFWRTDLLCSLTEAFHASDAISASVAYQHLARGAGWRCVVARQCDLICEDEEVLTGVAGFSRGRTLRGLRNHFCRGGWSASLQSAAVAAIGCIVRPSLLPEAIGQAFGAIGSGSLSRRIKAQEVISCDERSQTLQFPHRQDSLPQRRVA